MEGTAQDDIRRLLRSFGIKADETVTAYLKETSAASPLRLRVLLEDVTDYGASPPADRLRLEVEGEVRR